ncbi:hypothetical protein scyTo_0019783 [Scyliorhinus torazame]|uniref:S1 motif domain-containing protein n=1 Tax=Scyliorhinus torazame TaxID=75743 RepID=A0A401PR15_SCYTO|nr:hypothetical protein [Scyliorhinus torazame]
MGTLRCEVESKKRKRKKELNPDKAKKKGKEKNAVLQTKESIGAEILSFKKLKVGTLLLGCVKEVTDYELVVGLPHGLTGYVSLTNICDAYTKSLREQINEELAEVSLNPL